MAKDVESAAATEGGWSVGDQVTVLLAHLRLVYSDPNASLEAKSAAFNDDFNIAALVQLMSRDPVAFANVIKEIDKITGLGVKVLKEVVNKRAANKEQHNIEHEESESEVTKEARLEARGIIERGETYNYIYNVWQKKVEGNPCLGKSLIISRGVQSCLNSKGIHIYAHGKPGQGKSHGMEVAVELLPETLVKDGDVSPKVLYYMQNNGLLLPATTLLLDDLDLNNPLSALFKRVTTKFQKGAGHRVVFDAEVFELKLPPRIAIWTNSVDFQGDEQHRDRYLDIPIDENQTAKIIEYMKQEDQNPPTDELKEFETAVCKELFIDLASKTFVVEIPFTDKIDFPISENTRGYGIFSDLIKGLAALRYSTRKINDQGHLLADREDFNEAKALYEGLSGHSEQKYATSERKVLKAIIDLGYTASIDQLHKETGLSESRLRDILVVYVSN